MKTALLIGASGLIGKLLLTKMLERTFYSSVTILVRKPIGINHPKLIEMVVNFDALDEKLIIADDIFCCLGSTIKQAGSKENFYKVDFTYVIETAKAGIKNNAKQFLFVSSMGANAKSMMFYNRVKGETEEALTALGYSSLLIFRPSLLEGKRDSAERLGEKTASFLMNLFSFAIPKKNKIIYGGKVAQAMMEMAQENHKGKLIFESDKLQGFSR